jgi:hypothetical protein
MRSGSKDESKEDLSAIIHGSEGRRAYFVRMRSNGASISPVATAAAIATPRDAHGYGEPISSADISSPVVRPESGTLKRADRRPLDHFSNVCTKTL